MITAYHDSVQRVVVTPFGTRSKCRVVVGPFNTICHSRDVWEVKQKLKVIAECERMVCPTCKQKVK